MHRFTLVLVAVWASGCSGPPPGPQLGAVLVGPIERDWSTDLQATVTAVEFLGDDNLLHAECDDGVAVCPVRIWGGAYGNWQVITLRDTDDAEWEAWFRLGSDPFAQPGEVVRIAATTGTGWTEGLAISDDSGGLRAWVGDASSMSGEDDSAATLVTPVDLSFAEGEVAFKDRHSCGTNLYRDFVVTADGASYDLPWADQITVDGLVVMHGGHTERTDLNTNNTTGDCGLGPGDTAGAALVSEDVQSGG